jgi:penicillin amidase
MTSRLLRTLGVIIAVIFGIILILSIAFALIIRSYYPETEGEIELNGLLDRVQVIRDSYGIPHIYASNQHDLFMAQGFVEAQDRFWQMEFWRRIGTGRLSELLGESGLESDKFIRTVGWHRTAEEEIKLMDPEVRGVFEAYVEGVNAFLEIHPDGKSLEFLLLKLNGVDYQPEPWTLVNSVTWAKFMAYNLGGNMDSELVRAHIGARAGVAAINELTPPYDQDHPVIIPHQVSSASLEAVSDDPLGLDTTGLEAGIGSNSWAVSGDRTDTGMPILANDPHLGIQMPSIWYEIGLHCAPLGPDCPYDVVGVTFVTAPAVVIGHNADIAWGFTNLGPDVQDLYIEKVNPENPDQYEYMGEWLDMDIIREEITVAGEDEPVVVFSRNTQHGPIINDVVGGGEEEWSFGWQPLALKWTALQPTQIFNALLKLNRAQNWDDFREAMKDWDVPSQNALYADREGSIGYQSPGLIPIRKNGDGSVPVPGWTDEYEWTGFIPFEDLPRAFNPPEGYIVTANNAVVDEDYPYFISIDWDPGYRARRIVEMIEADETLTLEEIQVMQGDNTAMSTRDMLPYLQALSPDDPRQQEALALLQGWDADTERDSPQAALYETWILSVLERVFADELGDDLISKMRGSLKTAIARMMEDGSTTWFDDIHTEEVELPEQVLLLALDDAIEYLDENLGSNMKRWRWGDLHTATFENQTFGLSGIGPIEWLFNRGPVEVDGTSGTVNNTGFDPDDPFAVVSLPSYRQVVDLGSLERSQSMHTTGQSGNAFYKHYDDMIDPWRNIEFHPMLWTLEQVEGAAESALELVP